MISLLILACSTFSNDCHGFTPDMMFDTQQQCQSAAYVVAESVKNERGFYIADVKCIEWGDAS